MKNLAIVSLLAMLSIVPMPWAYANDPVPHEKESIATLEEMNGMVRSSVEGGTFSSVQPGVRLSDGDRLLVGENAKATIHFDDGCIQTYDEPGIYAIDEGCLAGAALAAPSAAPPANAALTATAAAPAGTAASTVVGSSSATLAASSSPLIAAGIALTAGWALGDRQQRDCRCPAPPVSP